MFTTTIAKSGNIGPTGSQLGMPLNRLIVPIFLLAGVSFGQGFGSIEGTVTDENGVRVSGATVYAY